MPIVGILADNIGIVPPREGQVDGFKKAIEQLKTSNNKLITAQKALIKQKNVDRKHVKSQSPKKKTIPSKTNG